MLEVHNMPTAEVYSAEYIAITNNEHANAVTIDKLVMYDKQTMLESGVFGIKRYIQISSSQLATIPNNNDIIEVDSVQYRILNPTRCANPAFVTFWETELKKIKNIA